ncbi:MAG: hypothetical protein ACT4N4_08960 [Rhodospirillales bacterium]
MPAWKLAGHAVEFARRAESPVQYLAYRRDAMGILHFTRPASILALAVAAALGAARAEAYVRQCEYEVRVKSDGSNIGSFTIPHGHIIAHGNFPEAGVGGGVLADIAGTSEARAKTEARKRARTYAAFCIQAALAGRGIPRQCVEDPSPRAGDGAMLLYKIPDFRFTALNALCKRAQELGKGDRIADYTIWVHTRESGDVLRDCKFEGVIETKRDLRCEAGRWQMPAAPAAQGEDHLAGRCKPAVSVGAEVQHGDIGTAETRARHLAIERWSQQVRQTYSRDAAVNALSDWNRSFRLRSGPREADGMKCESYRNPRPDSMSSASCVATGRPCY